MKKWIIGLVVLLGFTFSTNAYAEDFSVDAKQAIAVEVSTGKVLYEQNASSPTNIASITKLLTVYLVYEAIKDGTLSLETSVAISDYPFQLTLNGLVSNVNLDARSYTVNDLLHASLITSSNSAAIALAEAVSGSESAFVDKMKTKLTEWGITDAHLVNVTGLNNEFLGDSIYPDSSSTDENQLSAIDVAIIARRLILDFPQVLEITSQSSYEFGGLTYYSTNKMLANATYAREGVDGLKTGTSDLAGACFIATSFENNMRVITVVLNAGGEDPSENRFVATNQLLNYVYQYFSLETLVLEGEQYNKSSVSIFNGRKDSSIAVATKTLSAVVRKSSTEPVLAQFTSRQKIFDAPLKENTIVGTLALNDTDLIGTGYIDQQPSVEMFAPETIETAIWPISWWNHFVKFVNEKL